MSVPDYLTYYFRGGQKPFEVLTDLAPDLPAVVIDEEIVGRVVVQDVTDKKTGELILEAGQAVTKTHLEKIRAAKYLPRELPKKVFE